MTQHARLTISFLLCLSLILEQIAFAQTIDLSGYFASNTPAQAALRGDKFRPLHLRYISYDTQSSDFKLLIDKGDFFNSPTPKLPNSLNSSTPKLQEATQELMKYFFIGLALPNDKFWVNLRPDSPDNILDPDLEKTDIGRIFLEADLQLKKDTSGFTSPQTPEGRQYWDKLYKRAGELFGTENITIPTITRPWIVPNEIIIREAPDSAYIYKATLKVMLEEDYLNKPETLNPKPETNPKLKTQDSKPYEFKDPRLKELNEYSTELIRETIIPKLTYEINTSKRYAHLRQVYYSLILAQWFKGRFRSQITENRAQSTEEANSYLKLIDSGNLTSNLQPLTSCQPYSKESYFKQYQKSFQDGEYNISEQVRATQGQSIRRYVSGGANLGTEAIKKATSAIVTPNNPHMPVPDNSKYLSGRFSSGRTFIINIFLSGLLAGLLYMPSALALDSQRILMGFYAPRVIITMEKGDSPGNIIKAIADESGIKLTDEETRELISILKSANPQAGGFYPAGSKIDVTTASDAMIMKALIPRHTIVAQREFVINGKNIGVFFTTQNIPADAYTITINDKISEIFIAMNLPKRIEDMRKVAESDGFIKSVFKGVTTGEFARGQMLATIYHEIIHALFNERINKGKIDTGYMNGLLDSHKVPEEIKNIVAQETVGWEGQLSVDPTAKMWMYYLIKISFEGPAGAAERQKVKLYYRIVLEEIFKDMGYRGRDNFEDYVAFLKDKFTPEINLSAAKAYRKIMKEHPPKLPFLEGMVYKLVEDNQLIPGKGEELLIPEEKTPGSKSSSSLAQPRSLRSWRFSTVGGKFWWNAYKNYVKGVEDEVRVYFNYGIGMQNSAVKMAMEILGRRDAPDAVFKYLSGAPEKYSEDNDSSKFVFYLKTAEDAIGLVRLLISLSRTNPDYASIPGKEPFSNTIWIRGTPLGITGAPREEIRDRNPEALKRTLEISNVFKEAGFPLDFFIKKWSFSGRKIPQPLNLNELKQIYQDSVLQQFAKGAEVIIMGGPGTGGSGTLGAGVKLGKPIDLSTRGKSPLPVEEITVLDSNSVRVRIGDLAYTVKLAKASSEITAAQEGLSKADKPGGIDMRALPIRTEVMRWGSSPLTSGPHPLMFSNLDLDKEFAQLTGMVNADIRPSLDRLARYAAAANSGLLYEYKEESGRIMELFTDILRNDETSPKQLPLEPALKDLLATLDK